MNELLNPFFQSDETLHSIRKVLKDVLHNSAYISGAAKSKKGFSVFPDFEDMKATSKQLGIFQNKCSALAMLHEYDPKNEDNKPGKIFLRDLEKKWKEEKEMMRQNLGRMIQTKIFSDSGRANKYSVGTALPEQLLQPA